MQPYAVRMHFLPASKKSMKSRAESACREPYALYAPLLGVGVFSAFFLLRELHTVHTTAYGGHRNRALALPPVGIEASPAREDRKCIRRCIRLSGRKTPIVPLLEAAGGIAPTTRLRGVMESPRIPHIHLFPSASSPATCPREAPICRFSAPLAGFRPKRRWTGGHRRHRPSVAVYQARGASPARKRRSAVALPHSPGSPPTHKALVTLEKTSRLDRRKGQGTTCPQRICLQAMRR